MRRRQILSQLNPRDNRAPVPSGAGMGAAAPVVDRVPPVSREEEERDAAIWKMEWPVVTEPDGSVTIHAHRHAIRSQQDLTPATDPTANAPKKRGWPKGKKRGPKYAS